MLILTTFLMSLLLVPLSLAVGTWFGASGEMLWVYAVVGVVASYRVMRHQRDVSGPERERKKDERRRAGKSLCPFGSSRW